MDLKILRKLYKIEKKGSMFYVLLFMTILRLFLSLNYLMDLFILLLLQILVCDSIYWQGYHAYLRLNLYPEIITLKGLHLHFYHIILQSLQIRDTKLY